MKKSEKLIALVLIFCACNTTKVVSSWKAPDAKPMGSFQKVMVIALFGTKYTDMRQSMENKMVQELKSKGINAVSTFELYGPQAFQGMQEKDVTDKLSSDGADAALTIALLDRQKERYYTPGNMYSPYGYYYRFGWYYSTMYDRIYTPGYYTTTVDYLLETNVYSLKNNRDQLTYSVQTRSSDPATTQSMANEVSTKVVKDMVNKGILPTH